MSTKVRIVGMTVLCWALALLAGCQNPDGTVNKTETGALVGGVVGALAGAAAGGRYAPLQSFVGAAIGAGTGALVGHMIDEDERARLQQQSPQTLQTIDQNDQIAQEQADAQQNAAPSDSGQSQQPANTPAPTPLKVDDIKALTAAGVKPDAIIQAIKESKPQVYSAEDIQAAQQANPPVDPSVIAYMQNPTS